MATSSDNMEHRKYQMIPMDPAITLSSNDKKAGSPTDSYGSGKDAYGSNDNKSDTYGSGTVLMTKFS
jgi:hypothetical protein